LDEIAPRGFEPLKANQEAIINTELTKSQDSVLSTGLDKVLQKYPELGQIITAWPELSEQDRKAVLDIVRGR
jgi:F0F1-type ATP synthase beta subunit